MPKQASRHTTFCHPNTGSTHSAGHRKPPLSVRMVNNSIWSLYTLLEVVVEVRTTEVTSAGVVRLRPTPRAFGVIDKAGICSTLKQPNNLDNLRHESIGYCLKSQGIRSRRTIAVQHVAHARPSTSPSQAVRLAYKIKKPARGANTSQVKERAQFCTEVAFVHLNVNLAYKRPSIFSFSCQKSCKSYQCKPINALQHQQGSDSSSNTDTSARYSNIGSSAACRSSGCSTRSGS